VTVSNIRDAEVAAFASRSGKRSVLGLASLRPVGNTMNSRRTNTISERRPQASARSDRLHRRNFPEAGKSSLAFDTIYAGPYAVESLSAYARQFLGQMDRQKATLISSRIIACDLDRSEVGQPESRSTVGTVTGSDYLLVVLG
jgi:hypothetical protein